MIKPIPNVRGNYTISDNGTVVNVDTGVELKHILVGGADGREKHHAVSLGVFFGKRPQKLFSVAALVAEAFIGPRPKGMIVLHKDDDKANNSYLNLYYGTYTQNAEDRVRNGKAGIKLSPEQCKDIKLRRTNGEQPSKLAAEFGVSQQTICDIYKGRRTVIGPPMRNIAND